MKNYLSILLITAASLYFYSLFHSTGTEVGGAASNSPTPPVNHSDQHADISNEISALKREISLVMAESSNPNHSTPASDSHIVADIRGEIARLDSAVIRMEKQIISLQQATRSNAKSSSNSSEQETMYNQVHEESVQDIQSVWQAHQQNLMTSFSSENTDIKWSNTVSVAINTAFVDEKLSGSHLINLECRTTLCRMEVEHDDQTKYNEFALWLPIKVGQQLPHMSIQRTEAADGKIISTVYLVKQGYNMPVANM